MSRFVVDLNQSESAPNLDIPTPAHLFPIRPATVDAELKISEYTPRLSRAGYDSLQSTTHGCTIVIGEVYDLRNAVSAYRTIHELLKHGSNTLESAL